MGNKVRIPGKRCISLMNLEQYGWNKSFEELFLQYAAEGCLPGRVVVHKGEFHVISSVGLLHCHATGRLKFLAAGAENLPAVGDWVAVKAQPGESSGTVVGVLPRKGRVIRRASGTRTDAQVVAANVDVVFLVSSLDDEFNPARIERYLVMASESGAAPIVVLHKSDLAIDLDEARQIIADLAPGIPLLVTSIVTDEGLEELRAVLRPGITGVLLGSSGVGKSTILNRLVGSEHMRTSEVRETDSHGRHTTTRTRAAPRRRNADRYAGDARDSALG